jgi:hypothetical protein
MSIGAKALNCFSAPKNRQFWLLAILAFTVSVSSSIAWKVSDVDFARQLGSDRLAEAYIFIAIAILGFSSLILSGLKSHSPQAIFLTIQRQATIAFGLLAFSEVLLSLSQYNCIIFVLKVLGYAYSVIVVNTFWIALDPDNENIHITTGQYTFYTLCTYFGMAAAGVWLQSESIRAGHLGILVASLSIACGLLGSFAFNTKQYLLVLPSRKSAARSQTAISPSQTLIRAMLGSRAVMTLILGSIVLNVLASTTEYYFIADFESRLLTLNDAPSAVQNIGSFVTLIGIGNVITLVSSRLWSRFRLGRMALPVASIFAVLMMRVGLSDSHSLLSSVLTLLVVESVYPLVVESNMQNLLAHFPEHERVSARTMISTIADPAGLLLSAILLIIPAFDIHSLGLGVACVALLLVVFSYSADARWRESQMASFRQMLAQVAGRCSTFFVLFQTFTAGVEQPYELTDDLLVVEGYNWLCLPAVHWGD